MTLFGILVKAIEVRGICVLICLLLFIVGEAREAQMPALLENLEIPYTFGKVLCMALTLDKAMTKRVLAYHNIATPKFQVEKAGSVLSLKVGRSFFLQRSL